MALIRPKRRSVALIQVSEILQFTQICIHMYIYTYIYISIPDIYNVRGLQPSLQANQAHEVVDMGVPLALTEHNVACRHWKKV